MRPLHPIRKFGLLDGLDVIEHHRHAAAVKPPYARHANAMRLRDARSRL